MGSLHVTWPVNYRLGIQVHNHSGTVNSPWLHLKRKSKPSSPYPLLHHAVQRLAGKLYTLNQPRRGVQEPPVWVLALPLSSGLWLTFRLKAKKEASSTSRTVGATVVARGPGCKTTPVKD